MNETRHEVKTEQMLINYFFFILMEGRGLSNSFTCRVNETKIKKFDIRNFLSFNKSFENQAKKNCNALNMP